MIPEEEAAKTERAAKDATEAWRRGLEPHQRRRKNHPNAVWHGWRGR
jgi:hypothetical protein